MARVPVRGLSVVLLCILLLQLAECGRDYDYRKPKKNRDQEVQLAAPQDLNNNGFLLADAEERFAEKLRWHQKIEEKKRRVAEKEQRRKNSHRRERDVSRTLEIRGPSTEIPDPPPHTKIAEVARYIVHHSDWSSGGYINHHPGKVGLPMATLMSVSDGFANASTGIPYMYMTPLDIATQDLEKDNRCTLLMSLAQTDYCKRKVLDPEDPRCAYVILIGQIKKIKNGTDEWNFASQVFFDRHPGMRNVPIGHKFRFARFKIAEVMLQDYFGGLKFPSLKDYFAVKLTNETGKNLSWS